jgi:hypothetical protein
MAINNNNNQIDWTRDDLVVNFNVGGVAYTETTLVLRPIQAIVDRAMTNDSKFISGDGKLFEHVLDYLRSDPNSRTLILPANFMDHARLREEARRYGLDELMRLVDQGKKSSKHFHSINLTQTIEINQDLYHADKI